jgi:fructose-1,6-bisphosphatase-3
MDYISLLTGRAYYKEGSRQEQQKVVDFMWYLWCGPKSPMFGKSKIATFENYFVKDATVRKEVYNPYFRLSEKEEIVDKILAEFGIRGKHAHIINGHVPVKIKEGEKPVKANGKLFVIDGGISKAYQPKTGIAGYTLIFNSHHLALAEHSNFKQIETDIGSYTPNLSIEDEMERRLLIKDTDEGRRMQEKCEDLEKLIRAYREGKIKEKL